MSSSNVVKHFHTQLKANIIRDYGGLERPSPECLDGLRSGACGAYTCKRIQAWFSHFHNSVFFIVFCVLAIVRSRNPADKLLNSRVLYGAHFLILIASSSFAVNKI